MTTPRHRIHEGSPCKVRTPKRVFDTAREEGTVVWKARRVLQPEDLDTEEVYITHRKITTENDCCHALAKIGVSQTVLVSEALGILADLADIHFESLSGLAEYRGDVKKILEGMHSESGKRSFCRFAYAIFHGCKQDGEVFDAIARSGMALFKDVLGAIACDHPTNEALKWMTGSEEATEFQALLAWSKMFPLLEERHKKSHPFKFIAGDVLLAEQALEVLKFIAAEAKQEQGQYQVLEHVIQAALPIVEERIVEKKKSAIAEKAQEKMDFEEVRKRLHMLKHKPFTEQKQ